MIDMDDVIIRKDRDTVFSEITRRAAALVLAGTLVDAVVVYAGHLYAPSKLSHSLLPIIVGVALLLIWILAVLILMRKAAKSWDRVFGAASGAPGASAEALETAEKASRRIVGNYANALRGNEYNTYEIQVGAGSLTIGVGVSDKTSRAANSESGIEVQLLEKDNGKMIKSASGGWSAMLQADLTHQATYVMRVSGQKVTSIKYNLSYEFDPQQ